MNRRGIIAPLLCFFFLSSFLFGQQQDTKAQQAQDKKKEADAKAKSRQIENQNKALQKWLDEDVAYIITDDEKKAFKLLKTDDERESFIESFWLRRDPTPDTVENEYKEDYYARIAYANERYASGKPGWKTDRGRVYIIHGKPDSIEDHPSGGTYERPFNEGGGTTETYPFQIWNYHYLEGMGNNINFEFVDPTLSGEFRLTVNPFDKDALANIPGAGLTLEEQQNGGNKSNRALRNFGFDPTNPSALTGMTNEFDAIQLYANAFKPPDIKFKDLESIVTASLSFNTLPFDVRTDFVRITEESVLTPVTIRFLYKDLSFQLQDGIHICEAHVYGQFTGVNGRVVQKFEDDIRQAIPDALFQSKLDTPGEYQKGVYLRPGLYKLDVVIKDTNGGNMGTLTGPSQRVSVPRIPDEKLATSSLILADRIDTLPPNQVAAGQFVLGGEKVIPNVKNDFKQDQNMNLWLQVYGLTVDEGTHKPAATVEMLITRNGKEVKKITESATEMSGAAQQMTLTRSIPLKEFEPGQYSIQVKITDTLSKDLIAQSGKFTVR